MHCTIAKFSTCAEALIVNSWPRASYRIRTHSSVKPFNYCLPLKCVSFKQAYQSSMIQFIQKALKFFTVVYVAKRFNLSLTRIRYPTCVPVYDNKYLPCYTLNKKSHCGKNSRDKGSLFLFMNIILPYFRSKTTCLEMQYSKKNMKVTPYL